MGLHHPTPSTPTAAGEPTIRVATLDGTPVFASAQTLPGLAGVLVGSYVAAWISRPRWTGWSRLALTSIWWLAWQGADTVHTLGHIHSARTIGAPMDSVRLAAGLQRNVYHNSDVTPRQHIGRASGGPITSAVVTLIALVAQPIVDRIPILSAIGEAWLFSNALVLAGVLTPLRPFDAWSILKWGVVQRTGDEPQAEAIADRAGQITVGVTALVIVFWLIRLGVRQLGSGERAARS